MRIKWKIVNVIATTNTGFQIDIRRLFKKGFAEFRDTEEHYMKLTAPNVKGNITVFYNGNLILVGGKSIRESKKNLISATEYLKRYRLKGS